jgi:hypothetical protein
VTSTIEALALMAPAKATAIIVSCSFVFIILLSVFDYHRKSVLARRPCPSYLLQAIFVILLLI